jgi:hypothetical protein
LAAFCGSDLPFSHRLTVANETFNLALVGERDAQIKLVAEGLRKIGELQEQLQSCQSNENELMARQQILQEEIARAEAQLDLIKELLLREPGL